MKTIDIPLFIKRSEQYCDLFCPFFDSFEKKCLLFKEELTKTEDEGFGRKYFSCLSCDEVYRNSQK